MREGVYSLTLGVDGIDGGFTYGPNIIFYAFGLQGKG